MKPGNRAGNFQRKASWILVFSSGFLFISHVFVIALVKDDWVRLVLNDLLFPLESLLVTGTMIWAARRSIQHSHRLAPAWRFFALGAIFSSAGNIVYSIVEVGLKQEPFPSPAEFLFLIAYLISVVGILRLPAIHFPPIEKLKLRLGLAIVMLSGGMIFWNFLLGPLASAPSVSLQEKLFSLAYPVLDLLLLWSLATLIFLRMSDVDQAPLLLLAASFLVQVSADALYSYQTLMGTFRSGSWLDLIWPAALILGGMAGIHQALLVDKNLDATEAEKLINFSQLQHRITGGPEDTQRPATWLNFVPYIWLIAAYGLLVWSHSHPMAMSYPLMAIGVGGLIALVLARQMVIINENSRMFARLQQVEAEKARRERDAYFQAMVENSTDVVMVLNHKGEILYASPSLERVLSFAPEELAGQNAFTLIHPEDRAVPVEAFQHHLNNNGRAEAVHYRCRRKDGNWRVIESIGRNRLDDPLVKGIVVNARDVTERVEAEKAMRLAHSALKTSEERYALAAQGANDGLWDWDQKTNSIYFSSRSKEMLGYTDEEVGVSPEDWFAMIHGEDVERVKIDLTKHLQGLTQHFECEYRIRHKDGSYRWVLSRGLAVRDEKGVPYRMAGSQTDITHRKRSEEQLLHDAFHDSLTGLPNRALFLDRLAQTMERARRRSSERFAVLFLDLDSFKVINDSLGHLVGDGVLVHLASLLRDCIRAADTVARLGGDEFVLLLEEIQDLEGACDAADRIHAELKSPLDLAGQRVYLSASIGIVLSQAAYNRPEDILRDADIAMYQAKAIGKACSAVFEPSMRKKALARLELESDLRQALERGEFCLVYQPILSLQQNRVTGFEALIRWQHSSRGIISPADFIPIAEETGLILPIGSWVMREACRQLAVWQRQFPDQELLTINVNLSVRQLTAPDITSHVEAALRESGLTPGHLKLEITESALIENLEAAQSAIRALRALGVQIHIDDFGTGYSSLSYLQNLPVDAIKIDRSFVNRIGVQGSSNDLLRTILRLASDMGLQAVAEGVETEEQLEFLRELDCPFGQGYFIRKPQDARSIEAYLDSQAPAGTRAIAVDSRLSEGRKDISLAA